MSALLDAPPLLMLAAVVLLFVLAAIAMFVRTVIETDRIGKRADEAKREAELVYRANLQHARWMRGDVRGVHGQFPPADLQGEEL